MLWRVQSGDVDMEVDAENAEDAFVAAITSTPLEQFNRLLSALRQGDRQEDQCWSLIEFYLPRCGYERQTRDQWRRRIERSTSMITIITSSWTYPINLDDLEKLKDALSVEGLDWNHVGNVIGVWANPMDEIVMRRKVESALKALGLEKTEVENEEDGWRIPTTEEMSAEEPAHDDEQTERRCAAMVCHGLNRCSRKGKTEVGGKLYCGNHAKLLSPKPVDAVEADTKNEDLECETEELQKEQERIESKSTELRTPYYPQGPGNLKHVNTKRTPEEWKAIVESARKR